MKYTRQRRGPEEMSSASSIVDGLAKESPSVENFVPSKVKQIGSVPNMTPYMDRTFFARGTPPPIAPRTIMASCIMQSISPRTFCQSNSYAWVFPLYRAGEVTVVAFCRMLGLFKPIRFASACCLLCRGHSEPTSRLVLVSK